MIDGVSTTTGTTTAHQAGGLAGEIAGTYHE
jgi:hypothetical protein